ncbi:MAG TPA: UDP-glucose 4-epimerase GalE [Pyrinomonadaceae bacterium]|jgi:UDP-glucose 4-epimerase|nr:UDP-glucose 4-epimerase GalE [Pyrinomonadaceae bacterium]
MRILVTGGAGYIGSVVTEELIKDGHEVVVYDNLSKGHRGAVHSDAQFVQADLMDGERLRRAFTEQKTEAVIHMAADALVGESVGNPAKYYRNNLVAGLELLDAMRACGVPRIVFSSTCATYGEPERLPMDETLPQIPLNPYGQSKLAFEGALKWYGPAYGFNYAALRYFNAAGATEAFGEQHDPESHLIPIVLQAATGKRTHVEIYGDDYPTRDGTCVRDYIHIVDLARAHILALRILDERSDAYNLGCGGDGYTVKELIDVAREVTGREIPARTAARRPGDPAVLVASSEKIRRELGWSPQFEDLRKIIESAWTWMQTHPNGYE